MGQMGHEQAGFTLAAYTHQMHRRDGESERRSSRALSGLH